MRVSSLGEGQFAFLLVAGLVPKPGADPKPLLAKYPQRPSLQILDASFVAGEAHVVAAAILAKKSWEAGENASRIPANEVLLCASSKRQIKEAIEFIGVRDCSSGWVAVAVCESEDQMTCLMQDLLAIGIEDDSLLEIDDSKCTVLQNKFGISEEEVSCVIPILGSRVMAVTSLVLERVSISDLCR